MKIQCLFITFITFLLTSCQEQAPKEYNSSFIDREKLDAAFNNDVSKVLFNHLYVVVDSLTYESLTKESRWKNTYAGLDAGLPDFAPVSSNSSTCYLRGHKHYIEILGPENRYNEPIGKSGIGFSLKNMSDAHFHLGVMPKFREMKDSLLYASEIVKIAVAGQEHTWFKAFYTPSSGTALHTWYGFYNPAILNQIHGKQHSAYTREAFLESAYEDDKLFHSIKTIRLICIPNDFNRIVQELSNLKCELVKKEGEVFTIASGDIEIQIEPSNDIRYSRISQITCWLNEADDSVNQLGNLTITNNGRESIWNLDAFHKDNSN